MNHQLAPEAERTCDVCGCTSPDVGVIVEHVGGRGPVARYECMGTDDGGRVVLTHATEPDVCPEHKSGCPVNAYHTLLTEVL